LDFACPKRWYGFGIRVLGCRSLFWKLIQATGLYRIYELSTFPPEEALREIRRLRPTSLAGYPAGLYYVAKLMRPSDRRAIPLRWISVGGANLPPGVRREIEAGFQAPVFETYACRETALIAWECPATGELHVCDDHIILEVLDQGLPVAPGEAGEVVVTVLHSFAQPFLRYRIHDVVVRGKVPCSCGAPYSTLHRVEGRANDRILFPGARSRPPGPIFDFMEEQTDWIRQFQLVQERLDLVILKLVVSRRPEPQKLRSLEMVCRNFLGPEFEFKVEFVDELMSEPGTKFRPSLCRIQPPDEDLPAW